MNDAEAGRTDRILDLVAGALERAPEERAAFLAEACGGDDTLRDEVQSLIGHEAGARDFLDAPALSPEGVGNLAGEQGELEPGDTLGDCRVIALLGEGGMGEVYLARDARLERQVAVKLLKRQLDDETLLRRFRHERKVLAALNHPNIARLYGGATTPEGRSYLVMEYVDGERLDRYCDAQGLGVGERLSLFRKVCAAVTYAHQNLVVHRDLKPANIRVTNEGEPKLLDFGIAKLLESDVTQPAADLTVTMYGAMTPEYASPEQLKGEAITTASDVYSLGVILYELLTGERPHRMNNRRPDELARAICEEEPARPSTMVGRLAATTAPDVRVCREPLTRLRRRLEGDLDNIVVMALRKEPARRYTSVAQFSEDIRRHCEGLPVAARKDTLGYRAGKFVQRNRAGVAAAAFVALALVGGLVATTWQAHVADQERDRARVAQAIAEAARKQSELSKKQADRLSGFLEKLLTSADPQRMGKDVKVIQVLDAASKSIDKELAGEPDILAQVHSTLSLAYGRLQILAPAEEQCRAALALFQRLHGDDDPATVLEKTRLANVLNMRDQAAEAEPLLRQVVASLRAQRVPDDYAIARALSIQGGVLSKLHQVTSAESVLDESLVRMRHSRGENSTDYLMVLNTVGAVRQDAGDLAGAAAVYRQVVDLYNKNAPGNVSSVVPQINLCTILIALGKTGEAESAVRQVEQDCQRTLGENNLYYGFVVHFHATLDFLRGDYAKAIPEARRALDLVSAGFSRDNGVVVADRLLLGMALTRTGNAAEAEPFLRDAFHDEPRTERRSIKPIYDNTDTALGECLLAQKRYAEAEPLLLSGYADLQTRLGDHAPLSDAAVRRLQGFYKAWGKPAEAERFAAQPAAAANP